VRAPAANTRRLVAQGYRRSQARMTGQCKADRAAHPRSRWPAATQARTSPSIARSTSLAHPDDHRSVRCASERRDRRAAWQSRLLILPIMKAGMHDQHRRQVVAQQAIVRQCDRNVAAKQVAPLAPSVRPARPLFDAPGRAVAAAQVEPPAHRHHVEHG
jgi:hypothetical protein